MRLLKIQSNLRSNARVRPVTWGKVESAPVDFLKTPDGRYFDRPVDAATGSQVASVIFWIYWFGQFFVDNPAAVGYVDQLAIPTGYTAL